MRLSTSRALALAAASVASLATFTFSAAHAAAPAEPGKGKAAAAAAASDKSGPAWQTAVSKHNGSGVALRYAVPDKVAVGETATVRLQFAGITATDGAGVEIRDPATRAVLLTLRLAPGEQRVVEIPYSSRSDGMQFIDVTTTQAGRATVQSVPVKVGSGELRLKPEGQRRTGADGEAVISLPAASPK
jgi:hypothetical protein